MPTSATTVANAKGGAKPYKIADGRGLYLLVKPDGARYWRFKYRFAGREKLLSFGTYPEVTLQTARERREEARAKVAAGIDPSAERQAQKTARNAGSADNFETVAREWLARYAPTWAPSHADKIARRLERDIYPVIGRQPVASIKAPDVLAALRKIEARGALETAHRAQQNVGQVFRYAVATGRAERDPTGDLRGALPPVKPTSHAAIIDPTAIGALLRAIDGYQGSGIVRAALQLAPLTFVRPGELRRAEWAEFDLTRAEWNIPAARMKMREPHLVPLSRQALAVLTDLHAATGSGRYVFPGARTNGRPMSENTLNAALRRLGYDRGTMTGHGFRAMARTVLDEVLGIRPDFIEHQLAHAVRDPNGRAYNRTAHLAERRAMMQRWADYLDGLRAGAQIIPIGRAA